MLCLTVVVLLHSLEFGLTRPPHLPSRSGRNTADDPAILLQVDLVGPVEGESGCFGGETAGLSSNELRLEYRSNASDYRWLQLMEDIPVSNQCLNISLPAETLEGGCVEFRLIQKEHGGGACNCWSITSLQLNSTQLL